MDAARKGIVTPQIKAVAEKENVAIDYIMKKVAEGKIAIPANKNHKSLDAVGIGEGLKTKINVNLGISKDCPSVDKELEKVQGAIDMGVDAIMDLSSFGKTEEFRRKLVDMSPAVIGTVPVYDAVGFYDKDLKDISSDEFLDVVRKHGEDGVDFVTIHVGMNRETTEIFKRNERVMDIVSRGGSLLYAWMELNGKENPFFERYDELLDICEEYDMTISLGDALRPGAIADGTDASQLAELRVLGELTKRAWERNVQIIIEGPGHIKIDEIEANVLLQKKLCYGAPFYVLGPIVTDVAPGYDHITSAIGGAIAASYGVDFLCYVTPAEHLRLPTLDDMKEGIIASKIAAHVGDLGKGIKDAEKWDLEMSRARKQLDWEKMFELALDDEKPRRYRKESMPEFSDSCTMCGKMCSVRNMNKIKAGESINLI